MLVKAGKASVGWRAVGSETFDGVMWSVVGGMEMIL